MKLAPHEIAQPLWTKLVEHYTPLLAKYRARLENPSMPEAERISLCWQIKHIKEFLALGQPESKKEAGAN
jgi:hypothetical protein